MASSIYQQQQPQAPQLSKAQVLRLMRSYRGAPEQAKQELCETIASMGWTKQQLNSFLDNLETQGKAMGLF